MKQILTLFLSLSILAHAFGQDRDFLNHLSDYIENTAVFQLGQEEGRAYHIPKQHLSLNGQWQFFYSETPAGIPADFFRNDFQADGWNAIPVPANWEMQGYGDKLFRNISTTFSLQRPANAPAALLAPFRERKKVVPFTVSPPEVPDEYNPAGAYRKTFTLPPDWAEQEVFLRFEKVASASFVWVNGQEVGYNEGAQEPSEYRITPFLREGENTVAVLVLKFSDGYYLEGQDYWRLAGIFDDVWLYATPSMRVFDWQVSTDLDTNYIDADLSVRVQVKNYGPAGKGYRLEAILRRDDQAVSRMRSKRFKPGAQSRESISLQTWVKNPDKWTAETPHLYDLSLQLWDRKGQLIDQVNTRIGFKETEVIGNTFFLNGTPIKLHGINSHMQHPKLGHVMDEATIRRDFEILKQFNFNSVRTSHYPPVNQYLELANEYGLYIIDEAGTEAHASEYLSEMPEYLPMYLDRVEKMVLRDRNHPSVLFWSAGNESGEGENISQIITAGKNLDPTRYWMYGGNADVHPSEEIIGPRYPSPIELEMDIGLGQDDPRPSYMDEYLSIAGNGGGGLDEFWRVIYQHSRLMGGAIWDFVSPGLTEPVRRLEDLSPSQTPVHIMGNARLVAGQDGQALDLNGHDQWVEVYRADQVEIEGEQLSLLMEVLPRKLNSSAGSFLTKGNYQFGLKQNGTETLDFYLYTGEKHLLSTPLPADWENNWHQLLATYDGANMRIYIDGQEVATETASGSIQNLPFPVNIGRNAEQHGQNTKVYLCDALIDNVGIFAQVLTPAAEPNPAEALLWLDFEQETQEGSFFSYGIGARTYGAIWPDRRPQAEMWQMKKSAQPLACSLLDLENGLLEVWNRSNFAHAEVWQTSWTLTEDEKVLQSGVLDLNLGPQSRRTEVLPLHKPAIVPGKEYRLNISSVLKADKLWAPAGFEVSWDQFELTDWNLPAPKNTGSGGEISLSEDGGHFVVSGEGFRYQLHRESGALVSMQVDENELLVSPLKLNVWRAPIANELDQWNGGTMRSPRWLEGWGGTMATDYYANGIHDLKQVPLAVEAIETEEKVIVKVRELALTHGGTRPYTIGDRYSDGQTLNGFESFYTYTFLGDGSLTIDHEVKPQGSMPQMLPRMGLTLMLDSQLQQVAWYGRGPQENYPDRKSGYRLGLYQASVPDLYEPYLIPQDHGLRTDNRWLQMTNEEGQGLAFSMDEPFNFNAYPYTTKNLTRALYPFQLQAATGITLNLDYQTTGVGGTARPVMDAYRVYPQAFRRQIRLVPLR